MKIANSTTVRNIHPIPNNSTSNAKVQHNFSGKTVVHIEPNLSTTQNNMLQNASYSDTTPEVAVFAGRDSGLSKNSTATLDASMINMKANYNAFINATPGKSIESIAPTTPLNTAQRAAFDNAKIAYHNSFSNM